MIEYLDLLNSSGLEETWIARIDGRLGNVQITFDEDLGWTQGTVKGSQPWVGLEHAHLSPLLSISLDEVPSGARLVIATGDERGPNFLVMAHQLTDPLEREQWALGELAGIAEAVAMMQWRDKTFVHRRIEPHNIAVGVDGRARLRAPIFSRNTGDRRGFVGQGRTSKFSTSWMTPEQVVAFPMTPASDVYQLALLAYVALTLKMPYMATSDFERLTKIREAVPPPPPKAHAKGLADLVMQNLLREPEKRLKDPRAFARAVREIVGETPEPLLAKVAAMRTDTKPAPHESAAIKGYRCAKTWDELSPTKEDSIRHCESCKHDVIEVRSIQALIPLLGKRCIAYKPE